MQSLKAQNHPLIQTHVEGMRFCLVEGRFLVADLAADVESQHLELTLILGLLSFCLFHIKVLTFLLELGLYKLGILVNVNECEAICKGMASKRGDHIKLRLDLELNQII